MTGVVRGADFTLQPGEIVGLRGANGSGKTTVLPRLAGRLRARADGVPGAMLARGFQGEFLSLQPARFTGADWLLVALTLTTSGAIRWA